MWALEYSIRLCYPATKKPPENMVNHAPPPRPVRSLGPSLPEHSGPLSKSLVFPLEGEILCSFDLIMVRLVFNMQIAATIFKSPALV